MKGLHRFRPQSLSSVLFLPLAGLLFWGCAAGAPSYFEPSVSCMPAIARPEGLVEMLRELRAGSPFAAAVVLDMFVDRDGRVQNIVVVESEGRIPELPQILEASQRLRFHPALVDGSLRGVWVRQPLRLSAQRP